MTHDVIPQVKEKEDTHDEDSDDKTSAIMFFPTMHANFVKIRRRQLFKTFVSSMKLRIFNCDVFERKEFLVRTTDLETAYARNKTKAS